MKKLIPSIRPLPEGTAMSDYRILIATWLGSGRIKPASGTMGTLASVPFGYAFAYFTGITGLLIAIPVVFAIGTYCAKYYGEKSGQKDDQAIVIDETVGLLIAAIPAGISPELWVLAFLLFRMFDIYKPWPASFFDKRKNATALDVMLDDVIAGIYAFLGVASVSIFMTMNTGSL